MNWQFKAVAVSSEVNLNRLARHFGLNRKYKWEEPFRLRDDTLKGLIKDSTGKQVYIFNFGSLVFVNCQNHDITDVVQYIKKIEKNVTDANPFEFNDDYQLEVNPSEPPVVNNDCLIVEAREEYHGEVIATILAKSVALEKTEFELEALLDDVETVVTYLKKGQLTLSDEQLAKLSGRILGFKFNTISYIMLLDKPYITWINESAGALFDKLAVLFELTDRYESIRQKTEILMDITEVFSGLAHAKRGNRLEWAIIILISIELILSLVQTFILK
ncbi:Hypothetical protein LUCI_2923 [Lucifera butyrica]|uniref:DUF155 domain-containing protein n=1 Tax=Lucifera butyrica TaxID=1351585 RepID=A0A498REQ3_9FIRM|nr:RMD1 family protein [Lucifera butyrica]VBB07658.1 Hypothetical protein LUCI_2923 [Lucifera butyrica]